MIRDKRCLWEERWGGNASALPVWVYWVRCGVGHSGRSKESRVRDSPGAVPGAGKSLVALDLCRRIIHGEPFPDGTPMTCAGAPVLYVDADAVPQITNACAAHWQMDTQRLYLMLPEGDALLDFGQDADRDRLVEMVYTVKPALIIVDSLSSVSSKSENTVEDVRALLGFFSNLARESGVGLVLIHHVRKRNSGRLNAPQFTPLTLDDFRGSGHIVAMARSVLGLSVVPQGAQSDSNGPRQLEVIKSDLARVPAPLGFEMLPLTPTGVLLKWGTAPERWPAPTMLNECALHLPVPTPLFLRLSISWHPWPYSPSDFPRKLQRLRWRYRKRAYRYALLEAGHIGQNIYLAATAMGMGACAVGAFYDDAVNALVGVDGMEEAVLYVLAIGAVT